MNRIPRPSTLRRRYTLTSNAAGVSEAYRQMRLVMPAAQEQATLERRVEREYQKNVRMHKRTLEKERRDRDYLDGMNWGRVAELLDKGITLEKAKRRVLREMAKGIVPYYG